MAVYVLKCEKCGEAFEIALPHSSLDKYLRDTYCCEGSSLVRDYSSERSSFHLKGDGWTGNNLGG